METDTKIFKEWLGGHPKSPEKGQPPVTSSQVANGLVSRTRPWQHENYDSLSPLASQIGWCATLFAFRQH
jgi:hypothetical protein